MADESWSTHIRALIALGLPLMGSNLAQFAIQLTDTVMLGWYDVEALAAVTLAGGLHFLVFMLGNGFGFAVTPLVAAAEARGDTVEARRVTRMALWLVIGYALLFLPLYLFTTPLLRAIGQDPHLADLAGRYMRVIWLTLAPSLAVMVLKGFLSALEHPGAILRATIGAALANIVLNRVLIFGAFGLPPLGVTGAALASTVTVLVSLVWLTLYTRRRLPEQQIFRRLWVADRWAFLRVFTLGLPLGLTALAESGLFVAASALIGWIGTVELAAHGVALQIAALFFMAHLGLSQAATVRAARFYGRGDMAELRRCALAALSLSGVIVLATVIVLLSTPRVWLSLFIDPADPLRGAILDLGVQLLAVAALFQLVDAAQVIMLALLRGVQDTRVPMILAVICYWGLGIGAALLLGFTLDLGAVGVWLGLCVGLGAAALAMSVRFWRGSRA